jgi:hypothetical protein
VCKDRGNIAASGKYQKKILEKIVESKTEDFLKDCGGKTRKTLRNYFRQKTA